MSAFMCRAFLFALLATTHALPVQKAPTSPEGLGKVEYDRYVRNQRRKTDALSKHGRAQMQWVQRSQIETIAQHVRSHAP